jgi:4-hydroxy-tetrahydrodipicolinate synthase
MQLTGLWAAIPTPWDAHGRLDEAVLERNIDRYLAHGVDGVYTTDSDGEFYGIELAEFQQLIAAFSRKINATSMDAAVGVTWSHTQGVIDRIRVALDHGIAKVHVAFPYWMPLAPTDVDHFFADLARAAPDARWIHYNTPNTSPMLTGKDYARLAGAHPDQLIGSKQGSTNLVALAEIIGESPHLAHFMVEYNLVPGFILGARGVYSYWVNTLPAWERRWVNACLTRDWDTAWQMQVKLLKWERTYIARVRAAGHRHGIVGKTRAALTGFLEDTGYTRAPYYPVEAELQDWLKQAFDQFWGDEIDRVE